MRQRKLSRKARRVGGKKLKSPSPKTRRAFLRLGGAGVAGLAFAGGPRAHADEGVVDNDPGNTGLQVTTLNPDDCLSYYEDTTTLEILDVGDDLAAGTVLVAEDNCEFQLESEVASGDPDVNYDTSNNDSLEVDMSTLEVFEENYDPDAEGGYNEADECPYVVTDEDGTIGING